MSKIREALVSIAVVLTITGCASTSASIHGHELANATAGGASKHRPAHPSIALHWNLPL